MDQSLSAYERLGLRLGFYISAREAAQYVVDHVHGVSAFTLENGTLTFTLEPAVQREGRRIDTYVIPGVIEAVKAGSEFQMTALLEHILKGGETE